VRVAAAWRTGAGPVGDEDLLPVDEDARTGGSTR